MPLKPVTIKEQHPSQPKPKQAADGVGTAIWPRAFEEGRQLGGKAVNKPEDLRGPSLDDSHRAGFSSNDGRTQQQVQAQVKHTFKGAGPAAKPVPHRSVGGTGHHKCVGVPSPAGKQHKPKGPKTAPSALAGEGHHRG